MTTRAQAKDDLMQLVADALAGETFPIHWPGNVYPTPTSAPWVRVSMQHGATVQAALGKQTDGTRRYKHTGFLYVEIFTNMGDGLQEEDRISMLVWNAMKSGETPNGVTLRNASAREVGPDGGWHKTNVQAAFEYHELA